MARMKRLGPRANVKDEPTRMSLLELDANVSEVTDILDREKRPKWRAVRSTPSQAARSWDCLLCTWDSTIQFPDPNPTNVSDEIMVIKQGGPTVLIVVANGQINGATTDAGPAADRARVYVSTGTQWVSYA
jgi:hypothetical protein